MKKFFLYVLMILWGKGLIAQTLGDHTSGGSALVDFRVLGTRSWIRLSWAPTSSPDAIGRYYIYWDTGATQPKHPQDSVLATAGRYYIRPVQSLRHYHVWVASVIPTGSVRRATDPVRSVRHAIVFTDTRWQLDTAEVAHLSVPSSAAVPVGLRLFWQDEFTHCSTSISGQPIIIPPLIIWIPRIFR
jgi:hypothetical protein